SGAVLTSNGNSLFGTASQIVIGNSSTAGESSATVDGAGSQWIIPNLGIQVSGVLTVSNGGNISMTSVGVSSTGKLLVTGLDSVTGAVATLDLKNNFAIDNSGSAAAVVSAGGILNARANSHIGTQNTQGAMTVTGAGSQVNVVGEMTIGASSGRGTLTVADDALFSVSKTKSALDTGDGTLTVGGSPSDSNPGTPIGVAVLYIGTGGAAGKLNVAQVYGYASTNPPVPPTDSTVVFNHNETGYQFTNTAGNGILINGGTKVRQEAGTTIFTAASGYQGGTLITGGRLVVNNASGSGTGSGAVNVSGTGVLGGRGTISGNITVASGGATLPGDSQILKVGSLKYQAGSAAKFTLATTGAGGEIPTAGVNYDRIQMTGNLTIDPGATLQLQLTASSLSYFHDHNGTDPLGNYFLFDLAAPITGKFDFLSLMLDGTTYTQAISGGRATFTEFDLAFDVGYTGNAATNSLTGGSSMTVHAVSSVPEPMTGLLLALGFGAAMLKRRR
ncbi:MAG: PEP-CTERM sorting domain-containing protein, partial [Verrucomicrobium sp.]|nr:PEP-CTERM sorting domain-containing protein [Verrucomicrobium sp.]